MNFTTTRGIHMQRLLALSVAAMLSLAGCGRPTSGPATDPGITGTYHLQAINGADFPAMVERAPGDSIRVTGASITLNPDNTFSARVTYTPAHRGVTSRKRIAVSGTYLRNVTQVLFEQANGTVSSGALHGNEIMWTSPSFAHHRFTFTFRRCRTSEPPRVLPWIDENPRCGERATLPAGDTIGAAGSSTGSPSAGP